MNNNIWGPKAWFFLHTITFNYPDNPSNNDKKNYKNFFESLQFTLPCKVCKEHYINHIKDYPIDNYLDTKETLVNWLIIIHNEVNKILNKPILDYKQVIEQYNNIYDNNTYNSHINIMFIILIVLSIIVLLFIYLKV